MCTQYAESFALVLQVLCSLMVVQGAGILKRNCIVQIEMAKSDDEILDTRFPPGISGLVGVTVTVPNMVNMLDWACLVPRPQNRLSWPRGGTIATRLHQQLPQR